MLTPGSVTRLLEIPGLATHARGLKTTAEALYLRDHFVEQLELANIEDDPRVAAARRTVVVVGASYSGTELVAQLRALADAAAKQMGFNPSEVRFLLLDLAEQVMPEVGKKLGEAALKVLRRRGIDVRLGVTLKQAHADHVVLSDDSRIDTHTIAWVTGVAGAPLSPSGCPPRTTHDSRPAKASRCPRRAEHAARVSLRPTAAPSRRRAEENPLRPTR